MMKYIYIIACMSALAGCVASPYPRADVKDFPALEAGQKGAVVFAITEDKERWYGSVSDPIRLEYTIARLGGMQESGRPTRAATYHVPASGKINYAQSMLFLEPGLYLIYSMDFLTKNGRTLHYRPSIVRKNAEISYGGFEVKAGETSYLGRLDVTNGAFRFIHEEARIRKDLQRAGYNDIISRMKPGVFYESGSLLNSYEDKNNAMQWEVISHQEVREALSTLFK
jgi:hypothetical protein